MTPEIKPSIDKATKARVFFAHQSVGQDTLRFVAEAKPWHATALERTLGWNQTTVRIMLEGGSIHEV